MSEQENVQVVLSAYEAFGRGDLAAIMNLLTEDIEWRLPGAPDVLPFAGLRRGHAQVIEFFKIVGETIEFEQFETREFIAQGDKVIVLGRSLDRMKPTGRVAENEWAAAFILREGKIASYQIYEDTAALVAALSPDSI